MSTYVATWPILAQRDTGALITEGAGDLADLTEADGYAIAGEPAWDTPAGYLRARVQVVAEHAAGGDMRPWTSREAAAAEWWDWRAE